MGLDAAVPCGLIINELVSNALKHAFPGQRRGRLMVRLRALQPEWYELILADDGVGLPEGVDIRQTETLGLQLVHTLVRQLNGKIELHREAGTKFWICFQEVRYKGR